MGQKFSSPLKQRPIAFNPESYYTCIGVRRKEDYTHETTFFHQLQDKYWKDLLEERERQLEAKNKIKNVGKRFVKKFLKEFPNFTEAEITDLSLQFQAFDLNQDGLIDYNELMHVLDDIGDTSATEKRDAYFKEIDKDGSGAIDFEEFLALIYSLQYSNQDSDANGTDVRMMATFGNEKMKAVRNLSLNEKLKAGLF